MATYPMNISPGVSPAATSDQAGKVCCLGNGDSLTVQINSAFVSPARITAVNFFVSSPNKASGTRFARFVTSPNMNKAANITYPAGNPPNATPLFNVSAPANPSVVTITDNEGTPPGDQHVWFAVEITDGNNSVWTLDPEVINTPGSDPRRGYSPPQAGDGTQTLGAASGANNEAVMPEVVTRSPTVPKPASNY